MPSLRAQDPPRRRISGDERDFVTTAEPLWQPFSAVFGPAEPFRRGNFYSMTGCTGTKLHVLKFWWVSYDPRRCSIRWSRHLRRRMASSRPNTSTPTVNPASLHELTDEAALSEEIPSDTDTLLSTEASASSTDSDSDAYEGESSDKSTLVRKKRKLERSRRYLDGEARRPYRQTCTTLSSTMLDGSVSLSSADEVGPPASTPTGSAASRSVVCNSCCPVLDRYTQTFKSMLRQGSELKRRKYSNPHPCRPDI